MKLKKVSRSDVKIRIALTGTSGSGKTYSSLLLAKGLCGELSKVCLIDTEHSSSSLYAHLGDFNIININAPHKPEKYIEALQSCKEQGIEVVIIDSLSHCWQTLLEDHARMPGNSFTNWGKITPRHNALVEEILASEFHVIATIRSKTGYVLNLTNGKYVPEKVGLKSIQRDGIDYEFSIVWNIDINHQAKLSKDRTNLFDPSVDYRLDEVIGRKVAAWCTSDDQLAKRIRDTKSISELMHLYSTNPGSEVTHRKEYKQRQLELKEVEVEGTIGTFGKNGKGVSHG